MTEDQSRLLLDLIKLDTGLTDWEVKFIEDLERTRERLGSMFMITERQWSKMKQIGEDRL